VGALVANPFPTISTVQRSTVTAQDIPVPCDPLDPTCFPGVGGGGPGFGPPVSITIDITASVTNILKALLPAITAAITGALGGQLAGISGQISDLSNAITDPVNGIVGQLETFTNSAFGAIGDAIGNALSNFGGLLHDLFVNIIGGIKDVLGVIASALTALGTIIFNEFESLIQAIKDGGAQAIIPTLQLIVTAINDVHGIIAAIQTDIHAGVGAMILLPTQIASSLGGLEAAIARATNQINITGLPQVNSTVSISPGGLPPEILGQIGTFFADSKGLGSFQDLFSFNPGSVSGCFSPTLLPTIENIKNIASQAPYFIKVLWWALMDMLIGAVGVVPLIGKLTEQGKEALDVLCPVGRLKPSDIVQALRRGILDGISPSEEFHANNINDARANVLKALDQQQLSAGDIIDALYRGNTDTASSTSLLHALGYSDAQIQILQANAHTLPSLNDILRWKDYHATDAEGATALLKALKYTDAFITNLFNTYRTGQTTAQWLQGYGRTHIPALTDFFSFIKDQPPQELLDAAEREQLTFDNANLAWVNHWVLPNFQQAIQMYFRNLLDPASVQTLMAMENIPPAFHDVLLQMERPLFQGRQVTTLLANGIMSEAEAVIELNAHGYDAVHIKHLIDYAHIQKKASTATALTGIAALSLGTARTLFEDGAITEQQYIQVLVAHKVPEDIAKLQADAELTAFHAKQRKAQIEVYVEEVLANIISVDSAIQQMQAQGYSPTEILSFQTKVRRQVKSTAKHPSVAEMRTFIKAQVITLDQFKNELELQGWGEPWLSAWLALETPPPAVP
jgi:hypothetical protein